MAPRSVPASASDTLTENYPHTTRQYIDTVQGQLSDLRQSLASVQAQHETAVAALSLQRDGYEAQLELVQTQLDSQQAASPLNGVLRCGFQGV